MKTAICYSGQIGAMFKAYHNQHSQVLLPNNCDVYCYTSDAVSQKDNYNLNLNPINEPIGYLKADVGWRKNYKTYGIIYSVDKNLIEESFKSLYKDKLISYHIEQEVITGDSHDTNMTKWEWMRKRQLYKMNKCNDLLKESKEKYDIVIRSRFEFASKNKIVVEDIINKNGGLDKNKNTIFVFGGFSCSPPMIFMDEYFCDGFMFGTPEVIDIACSLYDKVEPYPPNPKYISTWEKWGDSIEHQFRTHMLENDVEIKYISTQRQDYAIAR